MTHQTMEQTPNQALCRPLRLTAAALLIIHVDIHVGVVPLLPDCVGWAVLFCQLGALAQARPTFGLLRPFAAVLGVSSLLEWAEWPAVASLVVAVISLYFYFQLISDLAALAQERLARTSGLPHTLRRCRVAQVIAVTAVHLTWFFAWEPGVVAAAICVVCAAFVLVCCTFSLAKALENTEETA